MMTHFRYFLLLMVLSNALYGRNAGEVKELAWYFPLPRTHTGIPLANGKQGLLIWGENNRLNVTIARAGFWDHRGRKLYELHTNYKEVSELLRKKDESGLSEAFGIPAGGEDKTKRPKQIGGGRLEITFKEGYRLTRATLKAGFGTIEIEVLSPDNKSEIVRISQAISDEIAWIDFPQSLKNSLSAKLIPSWDYIGGILRKTDLTPPQLWEEKRDEGQLAGFTQVLPEDPDLSIGYQLKGNQVKIGTSLGDNNKEDLVRKMEQFDIKAATLVAAKWWADYWNCVPELNLPDPVLQEMATLGLYKQACATPPHGVPSGLQGPFMEEYQLPPWSNDYHFNINIQMIYWPALASNRVNHFDPLWRMVESWLPLLRQYGKTFFQNDKSILFPHAVDDGGHIISGFWSGTIDHATSAWVAQLAWLSYRYSLEDSILHKVAWPLMTGSFEGYWSMLEKRTLPDGSYSYCLPVSVSPEWKGKRMEAWGENASFQLAAIQMITGILPKMAAILDEKTDPRWEEVRKNTPAFTSEILPETLEYPEIKSERILLWKGSDLVESHRHHSHMAGIYPFKTIDPLSVENKAIAQNTLDHWLLMGNGQWGCWTLPWSSSLLLQYGHADAAVAYLHYLHQYGFNEGKATTGDFSAKGLAYKNGGDWDRIPASTPNREIMQLDATFGALNAILEILVQNKNDTIHVLPVIPRGWKDFSFSNVLAEGAFLVSAEVKDGKIQKIKVVSKKGGWLLLAHNLGEKYQYRGKEYSGKIFEQKCEAGETIEILRP